MRRALAVLFLASAAAHAEEWVLDPSVSARAFRNDNLQLLPSGSERISGFSISPAVRGAVRSETREAGLELRATGNRYPGRSDLDTVDYRALFSGRLEQERNTFGLSATAVRDSTLQTEKLATGQPLPRRQRTQLGVTPSYARALDETLMLKLEGSLSSVSYEAGAGLVDFDTAGGTATLQKALGERTTFAVNAAKSRYLAHDVNRSDTTSLGASLNHAPAERLTLTLQWSAQSTHIERRASLLFCPLTGQINDTSGFCAILGAPLAKATLDSQSDVRTRAYSAGAIWQLERGLASLTLARDLNPTGSGSLVETDRAAAVFTHAFDERLSGSLDVVHLRSRFVGTGGAPASYLRFSPAATWQLDPWWLLGAGFAYAAQRAGDPERRAASRELFVTAQYTWPRLSRSR